MLEHFGLFTERGPIPETGGILPDYPNAKVLERVRKAKEARAEEQRKIQEMQLRLQMDSNRYMMWNTLGWRP